MSRHVGSRGALVMGLFMALSFGCASPDTDDSETSPTSAGNGGSPSEGGAPSTNGGAPSNGGAPTTNNTMNNPPDTTAPSTTAPGTTVDAGNTTTGGGTCDLFMCIQSCFMDPNNPGLGECQGDQCVCTGGFPNGGVGGGLPAGAINGAGVGGAGGGDIPIAAAGVGGGFPIP